jgi:hypothetical protein
MQHRHRAVLSAVYAISASAATRLAGGSDPRSGRGAGGRLWPHHRAVPLTMDMAK